MKIKLKAYSIWEPGKRKDDNGNPHQEDSLYPAHNEMTLDDRLFIVCDGMGGHDSGEVASATVCSAMSEYINSHCSNPAGTFSDENFQRALSAAYDALNAADTAASKKMGTTLAFLKFHSEGATIAHIGDSRVYHIRPGKDGESTQILFETEDHSLVNQLVRLGEMTHEQARKSDRKNVITRAMQPNEEPRCRADIKHIFDIHPGDYFYICSDGMLEQDGMENGYSLRNIFSNEGGDDQNKIKILTNATADNSDNHTAIIIHITDVSTDAEHSEPVNTIKPVKTSGNRHKDMFFWGAIALIVVIALLVYILPAFRSSDKADDKTEQEKIEQPVESSPKIHLI